MSPRKAVARAVLILLAIVNLADFATTLLGVGYGVGSESVLSTAFVLSTYGFGWFFAWKASMSAILLLTQHFLSPFFDRMSRMGFWIPCLVLGGILVAMTWFVAVNVSLLAPLVRLG